MCAYTYQISYYIWTTWHLNYQIMIYYYYWMIQRMWQCIEFPFIINLQHCKRKNYFKKKNPFVLQNCNGVREARTLDLRITQKLWDLRASQLRHRPLDLELYLLLFIPSFEAFGLKPTTPRRDRIISPNSYFNGESFYSHHKKKLHWHLF